MVFYLISFVALSNLKHRTIKCLNLIILTVPCSRLKGLSFEKLSEHVGIFNLIDNRRLTFNALTLSAIFAVRLSFPYSSFLRTVMCPVTSTKNNRQINYPLSSTSFQLSQLLKKIPAAKKIIQLVTSHQYNKYFVMFIYINSNNIQDV